MESDSQAKQITFEAPRDLKYYKLKYNDLEFQIVAGIQYGKKHYILLDISGNECVSVNINKNSKLYLSKLKYRPTCAVRQHMERGESTIIMLKGLLHFVMQHEPTHSTVYFDDVSVFDCILPGEGYTITISLALHNFIVYGKTWYQRHFQAEVNDPILKKQMAKSVVKLNSTITNNKLYTTIRSGILNDIRSIEDYKPYETLGEIVEECFQSALSIPTSWMQLYTNLFGSNGLVSMRLGKNYGCALLYTFVRLVPLFKLPEFIGMPMKISREAIEAYDSHIEIVEDLSPLHIYRGGNRLDSIKPSYPYFREYNGTRKMRDIKPLKPYYTLLRYFADLDHGRKKQRKTRRKHE